jgi:hypothetical protein
MATIRSLNLYLKKMNVFGIYSTGNYTQKYHQIISSYFSFM